MPLYEYHCGKCKKDFEELVMCGEEDAVKCPKCGSKKVRKLMSRCSHKTGGRSSGAGDFAPSVSSSSGGGCSGCSGGNCSSCH